MTAPDPTPTASVPAPGYVLEYASESGPTLGEGLHERQSRITLDSKAGIASMETHGSPSGTTGKPIGLFRHGLPPERFAKVRDLIAKVRLTDLPAPTMGGPGVSVMRFRFAHEGGSVTKTLTNRDVPLVNQIRDLLDEMARISSELDQQPAAAAAVTVAREPGEQDGRYAVTVTNAGAEKVCLADFRLLGHEGTDRWSGVQIAEIPEEKPGFTSPPLSWSRLALDPPPQGLKVDAQLVLAPGQSFSAKTVAWRAPRRGVRYLVQAVVSNYAGPKQVDGCYRIRGAATSAYLEVTVE